MHKISARQLKRAQAARDLIAVIAEWWPRAFSVFEQRRRPLKLRVHDDVLRVSKGAITPPELANALRRYCANPGYLRACTEVGAARIDLDGEVVGYVTADEAKHAAERLEQYARRTPKPRIARKAVARDKPRDKPRAPVRRISLVDLEAGLAGLKATARARREKGIA